MGKRSNFQRIDRDFYPTPYEAILPLMPFLTGVTTFAEPCAGDGALVRHLEKKGLICVYASDKTLGCDALKWQPDPDGFDCIITNPPYTKKLMMPLINHFMWIAPTWLLLRLDFAANAYMAPFMKYCSDIVVVPRLVWIPGTDQSGKENAAWFRFTDRIGFGPTLHNNRTPLKSDLRPSRKWSPVRAPERRRAPFL